MFHERQVGKPPVMRVSSSSCGITPVNYVACSANGNFTNSTTASLCTSDERPGIYAAPVR